MARAVRWDLVADPRKYRAGFREAEGITKKFGGMVTKTAGLIGGAFAAVQVGTFLKDAIQDAREAAKVTRQTNAVIKATGGVANVTAKDVGRLSSALMVKVGVDDDVISAGQNMLLTFKNVRNEAGKQNDIFNQTTKVALDMTAALNQGEISQSGLEQTTMRLGKALNDPIKGISALTRVGVTFTQGQKDQIKTLVESGKTMEAQKIILGELKTEFGGAAAAAADPWQKVTVALGEVKEEIGTALLPAFNDVAEWMSRKLPQAIETLKQSLRVAKEWWDKNYDSVKVLMDAFTTDYPKATGAVIDANKDTRTSAEKLRSILDDVLEASLRTSQGFDLLGFAAQLVSANVLILIKSVGYLIKGLGILSLAGTHAGDSLIEFADEGLGKSIKMMREAQGDLRKTQQEINKLHGKDVQITAKGVWVPPKGLGSIHGIVGATGGQVTPTGIRRAVGGPVWGAGTATSDSIPAWLSNGEHVLSAREVQGLGGHRMVAALRKDARGFADGGAVGLAGTGGIGARAQQSIDRLAAAVDRLTITIKMRGANIPHVPGGWRLADAFLTSLGIAHTVTSHFRANAVTHASGRQSYHALDRAMDVDGPNKLAIWQALTGTNPTELIYSRAPYYKSRRGWRPIGQLDPITRADHYSHVHAAYRRGGRIPEDVFGRGRSGRTYSFHGGETVVPKGGVQVTVDLRGASFLGSASSIAADLAPAIRTAIRDTQRRAGVPVARQLG